MLQVKQLRFGYDKSSLILDDISFDVAQGEHVSIIGESGSGKTTLLKLLHGEFDLNKGDIYWKDNAILGPKFNLVVGYDFMKYVAQEFDLMPFISVAENVGKYLSNFYKKEKKERVAELLEVVELTEFADTKVSRLSGGQKQRVALARAMAKQPEIMLLDEPFSHIDNAQKQGLRRRVFKYLKAHNITCIVATHDREDVLGFSDRMVVLSNSKIITNDTPEHLYKHPKSTLIAAFFGEFNVINDKIVYAHQLRVVEKSNLKATVIERYFKGHYYLIAASNATQTLFFHHPSALPQGESIFLEISK
ncbi:ABC transporter ATP-binding protein [Sediminibacter sp. Hel_I_10]|uniref:ABC transporter ATP-binding protein n=1 Tax=Sediminibacter sp. Hel_I_10 TaxID=1392490 RepID=UPI0004786AEC|nr:ABC transporter ATP-binding protein [Sediminibacter sp. Hel_I_10]